MLTDDLRRSIERLDKVIKKSNHSSNNNNQFALKSANGSGPPQSTSVTRKLVESTLSVPKSSKKDTKKAYYAIGGIDEQQKREIN